MKPTRKQILNIIFVDAAENGKATDLGIRMYVENPRVSYAAFIEQVRAGQAVYERRHSGGAQ